MNARGSTREAMTPWNSAVTGVLLQNKLGIAEHTNCACFDIRQHCSAFAYGQQMADVRSVSRHC